MMEGIKGGGGRVVVEEDMGYGMQCSNHPYRNNPGGICAFCLQEKLGKLVGSSFPLPIRRGSTSSSSPSSGPGAASCGNGVAASSSSSVSLPLSVRPTSSTTKGRDDNGSNHGEYYTRRARISFLLSKRKKVMVASSDHHRHHHAAAADIVFKRSKSTATPRRGRFLDANSVDEEFISPRQRGGGFWSFLYLSSNSKTAEKIASKAVPPPIFGGAVTAAATGGSVVKLKEKCLAPSLSRKSGGIVAVADDDDDGSPNSSQATSSASASSFVRKVSRSRSVGCGSRSFSGDLFERISSGFGDCTLRRVESQREGKHKASSSSSSSAMKERVKCGGLFSGFIMMTSSSSSSSSSSYWVSSSDHHINGKSTAAAEAGPLVHGRSKSWGWAFASPIRAFTLTKPTSGKRESRTTIIRESRNNNTSPNLSAIPSLLAVRS